MFTTTPTNTASVANMKQGRQALIAAPIVKASGGKFEALVQFNRLATVLPEWGKEIAASHAKQVNQFRAVIDRPGGATGPLNNLGLRLTRPGVNGSVSPDGRVHSVGRPGPDGHDSGSGSSPTVCLSPRH